MIPIQTLMAEKADKLRQKAELAAREAQLKGEYGEHSAEIERIRAAEAADAGRALLDNVVISPEKSSRRRKEIAKHIKAMEAKASALKLIPARRELIDESLAEIIPKLVDAALDEISHRRSGALENGRSYLAGIAPFLAELTATDMLERELLGSGYAFDPHRHPDVFAGRIVASRFLDSIPARLTPDELDGFSVRDKAAEIASRWLNEITGETK